MNTRPNVPIPPQPSNLRKCEQACEIIKKIKSVDLTFNIINGEGAGKEITFKFHLMLHRENIFGDVGEFPHMAAIGYGDEVDETSISFDCGGSLIAQVSFRIACRVNLF